MKSENSTDALFAVYYEVRGHCVANLDPLGITQVRLGAENDVQSKLLATYKYHQVYNLGSQPTIESPIASTTMTERSLLFYTSQSVLMLS